MSPISAMPPALSGLDLVSRSPSISIDEMSTLGQPAPLPGTDSSFASMLTQMVADVNSKQVAAASTATALQSGQNVPLHQAVIAMEEANVSFQLMVEVRNKLLESYQEIMKMQV